MKPVEVLVVVDMQNTYAAARSGELISAIEQAAAQVVERGGRIIELAYDDGGSSTVRLPPGTPRLQKAHDDGSEVVVAWLEGAGVVPEVVRVVGVNFTACVMVTAVALADRLRGIHAPGIGPLVQVVADHCADNTTHNFRVVAHWPQR